MNKALIIFGMILFLAYPGINWSQNTNTSSSPLHLGIAIGYNNCYVEEEDESFFSTLYPLASIFVGYTLMEKNATILGGGNWCSSLGYPFQSKSCH